MSQHDDGQERRRPRALERLHGPAAHPRRHGVYQHHRRNGWHPHPHQHAARHRLAEHPPAAPATAPTVPVPAQQYQHAVSGRHATASRQAAASSELGQIVSYDPATNTASVLLLGSLTRIVGPVPVTACAPRDLALAGASCLVVLLDAHNPRDGVVVAVWPASGGPSSSRLTQAGVAVIGVTASSSGSATVAFPTAYAAAPVVVATSGDPAWTASIGAITAAGATLTIRAATPLTASVPVQWMANGL
jgi:hypothetical protein